MGQSVVSVELRRFLLAEERLEDDDLAEGHEDDGDGHEGRPDRDALVQVLGAFAALKVKKHFINLSVHCKFLVFLIVHVSRQILQSRIKKN